LSLNIRLEYNILKESNISTKPSYNYTRLFIKGNYYRKEDHLKNKDKTINNKFNKNKPKKNKSRLVYFLKIEYYKYYKKGYYTSDYKKFKKNNPNYTPIGAVIF